MGSHRVPEEKFSRAANWMLLSTAKWSVAKLRRRTEGAEAPAPQGARRDNTGSIRPTSNAAGRVHRRPNAAVITRRATKVGCSAPHGRHASREAWRQRQEVETPHS